MKMNTLNVLLQATQVELSTVDIILGFFRIIIFIVILIGVPVLIIRFIIKRLKTKKKSGFTQNQSDNTEQLIKLKNLLDCGAITQKEFDDKKNKLLNI